MLTYFTACFILQIKQRGCSTMLDPIDLCEMENDPTGNARHAAAYGLTIGESEAVLFDEARSEDVSDSSGLPSVFGSTQSERHIAVVYDTIDRDSLVMLTVSILESEPRRRNSCAPAFAR